MSPRIPLLIDTDPGIDDALALLMAFNSPAHEVVGLTIAAGNVGLDHTVGNALKLCEVIGRNDVPVFAGAPSPLLYPAEDAGFVHGQDGFGDIGYTAAAHSAQQEHAALAISRIARAHSGQLLLVALGPLTNLALALKLDPDLPQHVGRLVVMGGAVTAHGNMSAAAEFNTGFDPEAAHLVFSAFDQFDLCDWEATLAHGLDHDRFDQWLQVDTAAACFYQAISEKPRAWSRQRRGENGRWLSADALAMAAALAPDHAQEWVSRPVSVELQGRHSRGMTVVDWNRLHSQSDNARILLRYRQEAFEKLVRAGLGEL